MSLDQLFITSWCTVLEKYATPRVPSALQILLTTCFLLLYLYILVCLVLVWGLQAKVGAWAAPTFGEFPSPFPRRLPLANIGLEPELV